MQMNEKWIWQCSAWPAFYWNEEKITPLLRHVRRQQGVLLGRIGLAEDKLNRKTALNTLLSNIISSSAIENERLNVESVRSSLAKRLGIDADKPYPTSEQSEGLAEMMMDAITNLDAELTFNRLMQWHKWIFPNVDNTTNRIGVGQLRGDEPMQVVSGRIDRPTIHFEAPPRAVLDNELMQFINWFQSSKTDPCFDPLLRAAICHFWFVTLHPFDDGNGRITRALTDLALAQADEQSIRLYAMSVGILENRQAYYAILQQCQSGDLDITDWIVCFLSTLLATVNAPLNDIGRTVAKTQFWRKHRDSKLSEEQIKVLNRLLDGGENGFENGISASQYQKVTKVSKATATRHLSDLLRKECLVKLPGAGRNTRYQIKYT